MNNNQLARRRFIQFLAASPLFAGLGPGRLLANVTSEALLAPVSSAADALDVFDFERVAERVLPPAHFGYLATGTDGDETLRANRAAFDKLYLRAMRMVDTSATVLPAMIPLVRIPGWIASPCTRTPAQPTRNFLRRA